MAFTGQRFTECCKKFKASVLYTAHRLITTAEYRYQHERATLTAELSPHLQTLLQVLDVVKAATKWMANDRPNTATFTPLDVDYNLVCL